MINRQITFDEKEHRYFSKFSGKELCSATRWIASFFPAFNLEKAATAHAYAQRRKGIRTNAQAVVKKWERIAKEGTKVHKQIEEYLISGKEPKHVKAKAAIKFLTEQSERPFDVLYIPEQILSTEIYGICGTCDLIGLEDGGNMYLLDWKTNAKLDAEAYNNETAFEPIQDLPNTKLEKYRLQLALYATILFNMDQNVRSATIVHLQDMDGEPEYRLINVDLPRYKKKIELMLEARNGYETIGQN